jgi:hypothetical protein
MWHGYRATARNRVVCILLLIMLLGAVPEQMQADRPLSTADEASRLAELDAYWARVSRAVEEGNFDLYVSTCHKDGVLVSGVEQQCYPLSKALARWKQDFVDTKAGKTKASVVFRFRQRLGDEATAHESGIFLYTATDADGKNIRKDYIHFEALLLKRDGWKIMMEYQKSKATVEEWNGLR